MALRPRRGLRIANAGAHGRVGHLTSSSRRTQACVFRRSRAWRRQGLVARRDAVVVQRHRRPGGDVLLLRRPRAEGAGRAPACPRGAGRGTGRDARACPRADRGAGDDAARGSLAPERYAGTALGRDHAASAPEPDELREQLRAPLRRRRRPAASISATRCRPDSVRSPSGVRVDPSSGRSRSSSGRVASNGSKP